MMKVIMGIKIRMKRSKFSEVKATVNYNEFTTMVN